MMLVIHRRWAQRLAGLTTVSLMLGPAPRLAAQSAAASPPTPCVGDANRHRFDFWIGEWEVRTPAGRLDGHSSVQPIAGGCGLLENWSDVHGGSGKSLNSYNPALGHWEQFWIGQGGAVTEYRDGEWRGDTLVFHAAATVGGRPNQIRLSFSPLPDGAVRQFSELSADSGRTWRVGYEYIYRKR
ncbi:MAG: hypothetical protein ACHQWU_03380 [Gemmatimonadales bacterium]|jgi:hypothetical protein